MELNVGIDLLAADAVTDAIHTHAARYLERVYTTQELADCRAADGTPDPLRLAARFAAKEATLKALRIADEAVPWNSIEVSRDRFGSPVLELTGAAAALARRRGVVALSVSLTHDGPFAAAVVLAHSAR